MTAQIIDGRKIAAGLREEVRAELAAAHADGIAVGLATVLVGDDPAARAYLRRIDRTAAGLRVQHSSVELPASVTQDEVLAAIDRLNADPAVSGILVLRPLPAPLREPVVFSRLDPVKDIEAVHPENAGLLALGTPRYVPSTAAAVFHILDEWLHQTGVPVEDFYHRSRIVVVGRSNNVGKPAISVAFTRQAAVTSIDEWASVDNRLGSHTRQADVLVVAAGVPGLIRAEHIRAGAVVLDVGINLVTDETGEERIVGDVALGEVATRARAVSPVPGGVGPVTDVWLIRNTVQAARNALSARGGC
ncbi:bifunctional 5,10-methylenetetrahydrofolate dehydrogenase/5,10-methenyltetrahydrofolate cyclohydrolase [Pseudonocardia xinjiangensis]|uniref:bifunctional 5,10-methylenetetrahydrofolate dehydrogenase/5,10-methenyltetrahydrofolate cyclohydrolase n=1 Tax=Pseudonocardia xinjiangensis TaxID=75289 RepID=UPI003D8ED978